MCAAATCRAPLNGCSGFPAPIDLARTVPHAFGALAPERIEARRRDLSSALHLTASMKAVRAHQRRRHVSIGVTRRAALEAAVLVAAHGDFASS
jgi:hypothetical protein